MNDLPEDNSLQDNVSLDQIRAIVQKKLQEFGFTKNESKIYDYLSRRGPEKALVISKQTKIPRTEIYHLLKNLQEKGAIEQSISRPIKVSSLPIKNTLESIIKLNQKKIDQLNDKKNEIIELWNLIQTKGKYSKPDYSKIESATKKYLDSHQFRQDFKQKLKKLKDKSNGLDDLQIQD